MPCNIYSVTQARKSASYLNVALNDALTFEPQEPFSLDL